MMPLGEYQVARSDAEINDLLNRADELFTETTSAHAGGVASGIRWLVGDTNEDPLRD